MGEGPDRRGWALDAGLALLLAALGVRYALNGGPLPAGALLAVLGAAPLAARRRYPLTVLGLVCAATLSFPRTNPDEVFVGCLLLGVAIYSAAAHGPHRAATLAGLPVAGVLLVALFQLAALPHLPNGWVGVLMLLPITLAAIGIRARRQRVVTEREQQAAALSAALGAERARIARELHDVVTHHVSMMVIQAGGARSVLTSSPGEARDALLAVEAAGRTALGELRGVLGLLAADAPAELAPQPGLAAVPELVARMRDAGVAVDYAVAGEPRPVPDGVALAAYRTVQEALTNAVKHASGAHASVRIEYAAGELRIEVTDDGAAAPAAGDRGYGLAGLRERLALYGGTLSAGRRLSGGYRVRALLPLGAP